MICIHRHTNYVARVHFVRSQLCYNEFIVSHIQLMAGSMAEKFVQNKRSEALMNFAYTCAMCNRQWANVHSHCKDTRNYCCFIMIKAHQAAALHNL